MPVSPEYAAVDIPTEPLNSSNARQLSLPVARARYVKVAAKALLVSTGAALLVTAWHHHVSPDSPSRTSAGQFDGVAQEFQVTQFPQQCADYLRFEGCQKEKWTCDKEPPHSNGYRCCCQTSIWHFPHFARQHFENLQGINADDGSSGAGGNTDMAKVRGAGREGARVLRLLEADTHVCLRGPEDLDGEFTLAECGDVGTRFNLPPRGAGPIELAHKKGECITVKDGKMQQLQIEPCNNGEPNQMFQLTNGDKGMLQWSHGGNKCLDSENDSTKKASKVVLADCVYWPLKPSQVFVLEEAPKKVKHEEDHEKDHKKQEKKLPHPSLFCTSLMLPWSYEVDMMRAHLAHGIGIFACTGWAVFSNEKVKLKEGASPDEDIYNDMMNGTLKAKIGGKFHTALNTPVFIRYWAALKADGRAFKYDWTLKVDPDCVFFPDRLTEMLVNTYPQGKAQGAVWLNNCQLGLHGPIEVFNAKAFEIYSKDPHQCDSVAEQHGQEDYFLRACFSKLQIPKVDAFNLLLEADWACNERPSSGINTPPCYDRQVSFHPFKSVETYMKCWTMGRSMTWNTKLQMVSQPPSSANHHHA